jgi:hypothetical protein
MLGKLESRKNQKHRLCRQGIHFAHLNEDNFMRLLISDIGKQQYLGSFPLFYKSKFMKWKNLTCTASYGVC